MMPVKKTASSVEVYVKIIEFVCRLIFPKYPVYYFPVYYLIKSIERHKLAMHSKLKLLPIPNQLYDILIQDELLKSEHFIFVSHSLYDELVISDDINFITMSFCNQHMDDNQLAEMPSIVSTILSKPKSSIVMQTLPIRHIQSDCVFVKENCYRNLIELYDLKEFNNIYVRLRELSDSQSAPQIAANATCALIKFPYELPSEVTDAILNSYFEDARIIHKNYTYEIQLTERLIESRLYTKYFHVFTNLKTLHFRCTQLELRTGDSDESGIIARGLTTLKQVSNFEYFYPPQLLDELAFAPLCPGGLEKSYDSLRKSLIPFLHQRSSINGDAANSLNSNKIYPLFLIQGDRGIGKFTVLNSVARSLGIGVYAIDCAEIQSQIPAQTEAKIKTLLQRSKVCEPLIICLLNFDIFGVDHEGNEDLRILSAFNAELIELFNRPHKHPIFVIAITNAKDIKPMIQRIFLETIKMQPPTKDERCVLLKWLHVRELLMRIIAMKCKLIDHLPFYSIASMENAFNHLRITRPDGIWRDLYNVADKTQGFVYGDLRLLYDNSIKTMMLQGERVLEMKHFEENLAKMQASFSDSLGAPKVPKVLWSDIGGLAKLKDEIQSSIGLPLKHNHLLGKNMRRSGILLYGPPGTGKTLFAKAVATECNLNFLSVQGPELLNMYVGQSERNVREVFDRARTAAPCVIFLDELDSLAPNRGVAGDSGGVMDRVVSQLLAEMDCLTSDSDPQKQIFILAATNRPDLIDPALLRPGRFDKLLFVGPCITVEDKVAVLSAQMKKFHLAENLTFESIAEILHGEMTGADLYSICSNAWLSAIRRTIDQHNKGQLKSEELTSDNIIVDMDDFHTAYGKFVPSVSSKDMEYFTRLKNEYSK